MRRVKEGDRHMSKGVRAVPIERPPSESNAPHGDAAAEPDGGGRRRRWLWLSLLLAVAVGAAAVLGVGFGRDPSLVESVLLDRPAPPLAGRTLEGGVFDLDDHGGQVVVVNVWASWCTVCREEHPELEVAARRLAPHGVRFVGLNTQDSVEDARAFLEEMGGSSYPSVRDPDGRKALDWGVFGVPETFLVDQRGRVRAKTVGAVTQEWLVGSAARLLAEDTAGR
ncbi:MAG: redoxin domain-containing protein [Actinomycetota bacterium]|nr:redoxin domain-containing protein [Actinomycetota bacterium]